MVQDPNIPGALQFREFVFEKTIAAAKKAGGVLNGTVVNGGMVNAKEFWSASFEEGLRSEYPSVTVHYITNGIDEATCRMAKAMINEEKGE